MIEISLIPLANPTTRMNNTLLKKGHLHSECIWFHSLGKDVNHSEFPRKKRLEIKHVRKNSPFKTVVSPFRMENGDFSI
jgi:hypothetical protein